MMSQKRLFRPGEFVQRLLNNSSSNQVSTSSAAAAASSSLVTSSSLTSNNNNFQANGFNHNHAGIPNMIMNNSVNINDYEKVEKKLFEKCYKLIEKVLKYCQSDKMNLINSPPYIIDILPDICHHLTNIYNIYENKMHILGDIEYFRIYLNNVIDKCDLVVNLFKHAGKKMYEESSDERKQLSRYSLVFSHMLAELKSLFPNNYLYDGQNFRIAKPDAAEFWRKCFSERVIVPWNDFKIHLYNAHQFELNEYDELDLSRTVQLTQTKYVSIFEFDIFTRLFQPWNTLLNNWKYLVIVHPGYRAFTTYDDVYKTLQKYIDKPGSYLFRLSCTKLGQWAIGYVTTDRKILQTIPQSLVQALIDGEKQRLYLYPDGRDVHVDILGQLQLATAERISISKEQYEMYCDMGTSFQLCKICSENNKDRKLEPCGHLICSRCLEIWQDKNTNTATCPFCRYEIKAFEPIFIAPYEDKEKSNSKENKIHTNGSESDLEADFVQSSELKHKMTANSLNDLDSSVVTSKTSPNSKNGPGLLPPPPPPLVTLPTTLPPPLPVPMPRSRHSISSNAFESQLSPQSQIKPEDEQPLIEYLNPKLKNSQQKNANNLDENNVEQLQQTVLNLGSKNTSDKYDVDVLLSNNYPLNNLTLKIPPLPQTPPPPPPVATTGQQPQQQQQQQLGIKPSKIKTTSPLANRINSQTPTSLIVNMPLPNTPPPPPPTTAPPSKIQISSPQSRSLNEVTVKVENEENVQKLVKMGYDQRKVICALFITNNDYEIALEILGAYCSKKSK